MLLDFFFTFAPVVVLAAWPIPANTLVRAFLHLPRLLDFLLFVDPVMFAAASIAPRVMLVSFVLIAHGQEQVFSRVILIIQVTASDSEGTPIVTTATGPVFADSFQGTFFPPLVLLASWSLLADHLKRTLAPPVMILASGPNLARQVVPVLHRHVNRGLSHVLVAAKRELHVPVMTMLVFSCVPLSTILLRSNKLLMLRKLLLLLCLGADPQGAPATFPVMLLALRALFADKLEG